MGILDNLLGSKPKKTLEELEKEAEESERRANAIEKIERNKQRIAKAQGSNKRTIL